MRCRSWIPLPGGPIALLWLSFPVLTRLRPTVGNTAKEGLAGVVDGFGGENENREGDQRSSDAIGEEPVQQVTVSSLSRFHGVGHGRTTVKDRQGSQIARMERIQPQTKLFAPAREGTQGFQELPDFPE